MLTGWKQRQPRYNPAHAGNSRAESTQYRSSKIQPRTCGEFLVYLVLAHVERDTTPHMRGILSKPPESIDRFRYNPAHAGNSPCVKWLVERLSIQPRTCGEFIWFYDTIFDEIDTTPHMRGILYHDRKEVIQIRYNPAHAGNSLGWFGIRTGYYRGCLRGYRTCCPFLRERGDSCTSCEAPLLFFWQSHRPAHSTQSPCDRRHG